MFLGHRSYHTAVRRRARYGAALFVTAALAASCALPSVEDYATTRATGATSGEAAGDSAGSSGATVILTGGTGAAAGTSDSSGGSLIGGSGGSSGRAGAAGAGGMMQLTTGGVGGTAGKAGASGSGGACAREVCNGLDDDCDHVVDNGCPASFQRGAATPGTALGDSTGGGAYSELCGANEVLVGLQVAFGNWLTQVSFKCQAFSLGVSKKATPYTYSVQLGTTHYLASHPATTGDTVQTLDCPSGQILVGLAIGDQHTTPKFTPDYLVITSLSATCAELLLDLSADPPKLRWSGPTTLGPATGGLYDAALATVESATLTNDQIAVGFLGADGAWVDRVGYITSTVQVLLQ